MARPTPVVSSAPSEDCFKFLSYFCFLTLSCGGELKKIRQTYTPHPLKFATSQLVYVIQLYCITV
jgi:hypothetical protein